MLGASDTCHSHIVIYCQTIIVLTLSCMHQGTQLLSSTTITEVPLPFTQPGRRGLACRAVCGAIHRPRLGCSMLSVSPFRLLQQISEASECQEQDLLLLLYCFHLVLLTLFDLHEGLNSKSHSYAAFSQVYSGGDDWEPAAAPCDANAFMCEGAVGQTGQLCIAAHPGPKSAGEAHEGFILRL